MPLSRTERFQLKARIGDELEVNDLNWDLRRRNLLLSEFGFQTLESNGNWDSPTFEDLITGISDADLLEMHKIVTGIEVQPGEQDSAIGVGNWKPGYVRLFLSHSAQHKAFLGEVANELAVVGIHGFVAHDTMEYSKSWQSQIEQALKSMHAFAAVIHPEFVDSAWCHQEVGWALGRRVPNFAVRVGMDPAGFISREQWPSGFELDARDVAALISEWASSVPELGEIMADGLFTALEAAGNYEDAGAAARRIATLSNLTPDQWSRLHTIFWANDQVRGGVLANKPLKPFYLSHGQEWPPPGRPD